MMVVNYGLVVELGITNVKGDPVYVPVVAAGQVPVTVTVYVESTTPPS
jgi:hypothetical protein